MINKINITVNDEGETLTLDRWTEKDYGLDGLNHPENAFITYIGDFIVGIDGSEFFIMNQEKGESESFYTLSEFLERVAVISEF